jgi:galacturonosyltransferase
MFIEKFKMELIELLSTKFELYLMPRLKYYDAPEYDVKISQFDFELDRRKISLINDVKSMIYAAYLVKKISPDLILSFTIKPNIISGILSKLFNIKSIQVVTGLGSAFENKGFTRFIAILLYKYSKHTIRCFENSHDENFFRELGLVNKSIIFSGSGVNTDYFSLSDYPNNKVIEFLYVGRIMIEKGIIELLTAFSKLQEDGHKFRLTIIGSFEEIINIEKYKYNDSLRVLEFMDDVREYYQKADVVVNPSYHEGMSNVLLEAASIGRPLLASDIPGCREIIDHNVNGFLFEVRSVDSLIAAMVKFINLPRDKRMKMGIASRSKVIKVFDRKLVNIEYLKIIEETLGK